MILSSASNKQTLSAGIAWVVGGGADFHSPCMELLFQNAPVRAVIIHNQNVQISQVRTGFCGPRAYGLFLQSCGEPKRGSLPGSAFDADSTAHDFHQLLANGQ